MSMHRHARSLKQRPPPPTGGGGGTSAHPYHQHINHFQISSLNGVNATAAADIVRVGEWRDTAPSFAPNGIKIRTMPLLFTGDVIMHCHFLQHEDNGMMALYKISDCSTPVAVTPSLNISSPVANATYAPGTNVTVQWTASGISSSTATLKVVLYNATSNAAVTTVTKVNATATSYSIALPATSAGSFYFNVSAVNTSNSAVLASAKSATFQSGSIKVTAPAAGQVVIKNVATTISWTSVVAANSQVKIELLRNSSTNSTVLASANPNNGSISTKLSSSLTSANDYYVRLSLVSNSAILGTSGLFNLTSGTINITYPTTGTTIKAGAKATLKWTYQGLTSSSKVSITLYRGTSATTLTTSTSNSGSYSFTAPTKKATNYYIVVKSKSDSSVIGTSPNFTIN